MTTTFILFGLGALFGAGGMAFFISPRIVEIANRASADRIARIKADKANGVLRRELFELRATYEPTRNHGYGATHG